MKSADLNHMRKISYIWGCVMFLLVIGVTVIGFIYKNKTKEFKDFEKLIIEKSSTYLKLNNIDKITIEELKDNHIIDDLTVKGKECSGYVISNKDTYKSYIDCGSYKTKGY